MTKRDRVAAIAGCSQCSVFLAQATQGRSATHDILELVDGFHEREHEILSTPTNAQKRRAVFTSKVVNDPPSAATLDSHQFQSIFVKDIWDYLPDSDKLDMSQDVVVNEAVVKAVMTTSASSEECFEPTHPLEVYGEEQARPVVSSFIQGLVSLIGGDERVCVASQNPLQYFIKTTDENGTEHIFEVSPPGEDEDARSVHEKLNSSLLHDKTWKQGFVISSKVRTLNEQGQEAVMWIPRVNVEAKGDTATPADLLQASTSGWKLQLKRLQKREAIGRLYNEVWGTVTSLYCIQDIFGYLTVENGCVTAKSFERYQQTVETHKRLWGTAFEEESFNRCPKTLAEFQAVYDQKAREYEDTRKQDLPSMKTVEDFPVGVVYFSSHYNVFPAGKLDISIAQAARFIQGHVRVLDANWVIPEDPAAYEEANARLLRNQDKFKLRSGNRLDRKLGLSRQRKRLPPRGVAFNSLAEALAGASSDRGEVHSTKEATGTEVSNMEHFS